MKKLIYLLPFITYFIISCSPVANTTIENRYKPLSPDEPVMVYRLSDPLPNDLIYIGKVRIGDSGFTTDCSLEKVVDDAKVEARNNGGNILHLTKIIAPDYFISTCYRIQGDIYKQKTETVQRLDVTKESMIKEWETNGMEPYEGIYEKVGSSSEQSSKYQLALKRIDQETYNLVYLEGAEGYASSYWKSGDVKAVIYRTATEKLFKVDWYLANKVKSSDYYITMDVGYFTLFGPDAPETMYLKLYPTSNDNVSYGSIYKASGTGFAISELGYIVTNNHVINEANQIFIRGVNKNFNSTYKAYVVLKDVNNDLALLKIDDPLFSGISKIPYNLKKDLDDVGESVFILGYPLRATMGDEMKLTNGIISSKTGFQGDVTSYQISAPAQPGNSGGPAFNSQGELIGIVSAKHMGAENVTYARKSTYLVNMITNLSELSISSSVNMELSNQSLVDKVKSISEFIYIVEVK